jgi:hypothetical protein
MTAQARKRAAARRRSFSDVLVGFAAIVALFVLLAVVPLALIAAFGLPVPHTMPSMTLLTHRLSLPGVIRVCSVVVWLAWLQLVWCVIAEVAAALRNTGVPARVPLAGGIQALVHRLVTSALLLSTATALSPAMVAAPALTVASATPLPGQHAGSGGHAALTARAGGAGQAAMFPGQGGSGGPTESGVPWPAGVIGGEGAGIAPNGALAHGGPVGAAVSGGAAAAEGSAGGIAAAPGEVMAQTLAVRGTLGDGAPPVGLNGPGDVADLLAAAASSGASGYAGPAGHGTEKIYVVEPPEGRFHESLWEIAARHLGDGRRYHEIFALNAGRTQPDGTKLTIASLIRPGWVLIMPHDAHGPGIKVITPGRHHDPGHPGAGNQGGQGNGRSGSGGQGQHHQGSGHQGSGHQGSGHQGSGHQGSGHQGSGHQGGGQHQGQGSGQAGGGQPGTGQPGTGQHSGQPGTGQGGSGPGQGQPAPAPGQSQHPAGHEEPGALVDQPAFPIELAGAGLLGAAVLGALVLRRRRQQRRRRPGRRVAPPAPEAGVAEAALLLGADASAASLVDAGLRYLSLALTRQGRTPPTVFAAHVGEENLDLWVAPPSPDAPHPWFAVGDGQVWRLSLASVLGMPLGELANVAAPYPGLVSIGTDATGRVLVDVASAHGLIGVSGPGDVVRDALTAMAVELATSHWSEGIHLTLVGFGADLEVLAPHRVKLVPTLTEALPDLEVWATEVTEVLGTLGQDAKPKARAEGPRGVAWEPHYLISAVEPAPGWERDRLLALAQVGQAAGAAYLVAGDVPGAAWRWELTPEGRLLAGQLGLDVSAQILRHEQQVVLADMFAASDDMDGVPLSAPPVDLAPAHHLSPEAELPVEVTLFGPVSVHTPGEIEPDRLAQATEIVAFLATHPGGVHPNVLTATIWPRGVTPEVRDTVLDRVTAWLGTDGIGRPHLASDATGRFRLGSGVRVDWQVFCTLVARAADGAAPAGSHAAPAPAGGGQDEESLLEQALSLVTGPFLAGREQGRYAWLAVDGLDYEVEARIADAAHRLCELRLAASDPGGAMAAARTGLLAAPADELLWRDLVTGAYHTGDEELLRSVVAEICDWARVDDRMPGLVPETEALIDELLPSWRWSVA